MLSLSNHFAYRRSAIWLATCVCVFVFGWRLYLVAAEHFGAHTITRELVSILQFEQDLRPNSANTRLVYCQDTEQGVGIYFCDTTGGKPRLLCEQKEKGHTWKRFTMLDWSPDDSLFGVAYPDATQDKEMILLFNGNTGESAGKVGTDQNLEQMAWLSNDSFAYATRTDVRVVEKRGNTDWEHTRSFAKVATNLDNFTAISSNSVAWREAGAIWLFDLTTGSPKKIWQSTRNDLMEFTYSKPAGEFLLNCRDGAGQYLLRYVPAETNSIDAGRIGPWLDYVHNAFWTGPGAAYAYLTNIPGGSAFCVKSGEKSMPDIVPWQGGIRSFTLNGQHLYFQGNPDNAAPGIWDYDLKSQAFRLIIASTDDPAKKVIGLTPTAGTLTNSMGEQRFYHLWAPAHVAADRKYPLLLTQELNYWFPLFQIAADNGFYVAVVDRPFSHTWNGIHERTWTEDVMSLHEIMARNPNIDSNRIYLYASSAETWNLSSVLNESPSLWKGAVMFSPLRFPQSTDLHGKRFLLVDGKSDRDATTRLPKFQDEAAQQAGEVTVSLLDDADHVVASGASERTRFQQFAKFLETER
jgi:hypothetical protein